MHRALFKNHPGLGRADSTRRDPQQQRRLRACTTVAFNTQGAGAVLGPESTLHKQRSGPGQLRSVLTRRFGGGEGRKRPGCYGNMKDGRAQKGERTEIN